MVWKVNNIKNQWKQLGMAGCTLLAFLLFDIFCGCESGWGVFLFTRWSTWAYLLFFSLLFSMPVMVWGLRKTQAVVITILSLWLWASILYYRQFQTSIPLGSYGQIFAVTNNYGNSIMALVRLYDLLFLLPITGAWILTRYKINFNKGVRKIYWIALGITFMLSWVVSIARHGFEGTFRGVHFDTYAVRSAQFTPAGMLAHDIVARILPINSKDKSIVNDWIAQHQKMFPPSFVEGKPRDKVIIILVESLDSWVVTAQVEGQQIMPTLNKLSADSTTLFAPKVVSQTRDGKSSDGQFILSSGILPLQTGALALDHPESVKSSIVKGVTAKFNSDPYYFDGSPRGTWNKEATIPWLGFKHFFFKENLPNQLGDYTQKKIRDEKVIDYVINQMSQDSTFSVRKPWLCEIVTASSHFEYTLPADEKSTLQLNGDYPERLANYLKVMRYVDESIAKLLQYIQSRDDQEQISVVIIGDHFAPGLEPYKASFKNTAFLIPFMVLNSPVAGRFDKYMGQVDAYTTLIDLFCPEYKHRGMGISILNPNHPGVAIGSEGKVYGDGPQDVIKHLQEAFTVSDLILRYDLMQDE